ncbi:MAG: PilZ domain-containing protein [Bdellovibrionota bacterium]
MAGSTKQQKADAGKRLQYDSDPDAESQISLVNVDSARETNNAADKRSSPRFILRLRLQMVIGGKIHQNESLNISMGGIKLKSPLPEGAKGSLDVRIFNGDHEMTLRCRTLQAKGEETCTRLLIEAVPKPDVFRAWILAGT